MTDRPAIRPRDDEHLYVYSPDDVADILADAFVDVREVVDDDDTATECIDIVYERLTDEYYTHDG